MFNRDSIRHRYFELDPTTPHTFKHADWPESLKRTSCVNPFVKTLILSIQSHLTFWSSIGIDSSPFFLQLGYLWAGSFHHSAELWNESMTNGCLAKHFIKLLRSLSPLDDLWEAERTCSPSKPLPSLWHEREEVWSRLLMPPWLKYQTSSYAAGRFSREASFAKSTTPCSSDCGRALNANASSILPFMLQSSLCIGPVPIQWARAPRL